MGCSGSKATPAQPASGTLLPVDKSSQAGTDAQKHASEELPLRTIEVTIKKTPDNDRIGLNGAPSGDCWVVADVGEGLVNIWNDFCPDSAVEAGDKILACNGVRGNGQLILDAMKNDRDLQLTVAKMKGPPERSAPPESHEVATNPEDNGPETGVQDIPENAVQENHVEENVTGSHVEAELDDDPIVNEPNEAAKGVTSTMEEQPLPENDLAENARKPDGWMCCSGPRT